MIGLYHTIFLEPTFNALIALYNLVGDVGVAIIIVTAIVRIIIFPVTLRSIKSQKALQDLQPKLNTLKEKHKGNREALAKATMELYKQEKVNPAASCLPLFIQLPIFIALYQAMRIGLQNGGMELLYSFVRNPGTVNPIAFGFLNLASASIPIAVLAGASQFWQAKMLSHKKPPVQTPGAKDESMLATMNKQMLYVMPAMTVVIGASLPGGVILYWLVTNILTIGQQYLFLRPKAKGNSPNSPKA